MTAYLLDSHIFLWWVAQPERLNEAAKHAISTGHNTVMVSMVTAWELSLKQQKHGLKIDLPIEDVISSSRFDLLPITLTHISTTRILPPLHGDPFDRLLIAQAQTSGLTLITRDTEIMRYDIPTLAA